jgi:hypothetical protein
MGMIIIKIIIKIIKLKMEKGIGGCINNNYGHQI